MSSRSRYRRPPFFRFYIVCLSLVVVALAGVIGLLIIKLSGMGMGLFGKLGIDAAILACMATIFFLVWGMLILSRKKIRRSGK